MQKITVRFSEKIVEAMEERQEKKGLDSVAECVRELVEIGLEVESGKTKPPSSVKEAKEMALIKKLLVNNLNWSLEARLLSRYLVANTPNQPTETNLEILKRLKERSQGFVKKLLEGESTE